MNTTIKALFNARVEDEATGFYTEDIKGQMIKVEQNIYHIKEKYNMTWEDLYTLEGEYAQLQDIVQEVAYNIGFKDGHGLMLEMVKAHN